jgi:general secretion pathway protein G
MGIGGRLRRGEARGNRRGDDGFTLMELLIVVVVLGVLAGIVVFALSSVTAQAAVAACNTDASSVETAANAYTAKVGTPPTDISQLKGAYLRSLPSSQDYTISIDSATGKVLIAAPSSVTAVPYGTANACSNAGSSSPTQEAAPANNAGPHVATTTTTTAPAATTTTRAPVSTTTTTHVTTTTTTAPPPTTTTAAAARSNGVTGVPTSANYSYYGGQEVLTVHNPSAITAMTITIKVAQTTGVTYNSDFNSFPGDAGSNGHSTGGGKITYTYVLSAGHSIPANDSGALGAQFGGTGSPRTTSGDTWTVTSTSGGVTSTISGTF